MTIAFSLPYLNYLSPVHMHQPLLSVLSRLLRKNNIAVAPDLLEDKLYAHPYFPSLLSVSDVLYDLGIAHQAYRADFDTLSSNFKAPLLVFLTLQGGMFGVVESIKGGSVRLFIENGETKTYTNQEFLSAWDGIVLALDAVNKGQSAQERIIISQPIYMRFAVAACWLFVLAYILLGNVAFHSTAQVLSLVLSMAGASFSWLLVLQHLNKNNVLVKQLCNSSTNKGCGSVLSSKAAQLTPWLSMAEAGFIFFVGLMLLLLFFDLPVLYFYLILGAPIFSLYTIYLQAVVLKDWCKMCLAVHGVLFACFALAMWQLGHVPIHFTLPPIEQVIAFMLPALMWLWVKPYIKHLKERNLYKNEHRKLKANPQLFNTLLAKQPKIYIPDELKVFSFGNPTAEHELVFVSNPFCGPCTKAHGIIEEWLESEPDFKITIIFIHQAENDPKRQFVEFLSGVKDGERLRQVLHNWFENDKKDLTLWAKHNLLEKNTLEYNEKNLQHWLGTADVHATPTFFVNGFRLPENYSLSDIRYLIAEVE